MTLLKNWSRLGDTVWIPGRAASPLAWDDEVAVKLQVDFVQPFFVIPAKQARGLRELDLPPRKRGIQSLKHGERFDTLADRCCKHHTIGKGKRPNGEDAVPNGQQANRPKADLA
ncbi:hypothetical protein [Oceanithermus profundus]|uniref:hypothetical protein n=1 Tax=Oceanithermus profundus TaxID=187137 RepID=UPI0011D1A141|nr:hypothetical protein [Oceanithermus profundus]